MGPHSTKNDTRGGLNLTLGAKTISGPVSRVPPIFKSSSQSAGSLTCLEQIRSLSLIAAQAGIPYRTIHRCLNRYRRFALAVLAREPREDRGKRLALSPALLDLQIAESADDCVCCILTRKRRCWRTARSVLNPRGSSPAGRDR